MIINNKNTFHLQGKSISYIIYIDNNGDLLHYYFGKKLSDRCVSDVNNKWSIWAPYDENGSTLISMPQEYPSYGYRDLRRPAYTIKSSFGDSITDLKYKSFRIIDGIEKICGIPSLIDGEFKAKTLEITLSDPKSFLEVDLYYTVFDEYDIIARHARLKNCGKEDVTLKEAYSLSVDLPKSEYDLVYFSGSWARERGLERLKISRGSIINISNETGASGHNINPFVMVCDGETGEDYGEVYGFSLIYSGNHSTLIQSSREGTLRVLQGINPMRFEKNLKSGEEFYTPQSIISYSNEGMGKISRTLSDLYRYNLCRSKWVNMERPVLINNWEATYFDFNEEKLMKIAAKASEIGVELFVMDDGWFGNRNNDTTGLGDWFVNKTKLPSGLDGLANKINGLGMKFGIWIEPEMVNPESELYKQHPQWVIKTNNRTPALSRNQLILDLTQGEVRDYIVNSISDVLSSANVEYVKWDMNRPMTDMPYDGYNYDYTLGFYDIMERITSKFPNILFEGCSGGGGRFDAGVLAYMPQIWTSDNSDAVARFKIQYSTSMGYPISSMSAHVTAVPNHQNGRTTSLKTRADTAYAGVFGYELDITSADKNEILEMKQQIIRYKSLRKLIINCDFYRLKNPYQTNYCAWEAVSKDKKEAFVFCAKIINQAAELDSFIKLKGLDEDGEYIDSESGKMYFGDELMYRGFEPEYENCDFSTNILHLIKKN